MSILLDERFEFLVHPPSSVSLRVAMASSLSQSPRGLNAKKKKRVRFHRDTILDDSDHIALTITRHSFIYDKGYTQYFIKLLCRGVEWTLHKRYRDFYNLHHELIKENQSYNIDLPKLPEKRWFERQRWINRADEKYGWIRRIQLQDYLRAIVKIRVLRNESLSFWKFICMPKRAMMGPATAEEQERENNRSISMDSRQGSLKSTSSLMQGALTASELKSLKGKLPSSGGGHSPALEPEAGVETDVVLETELETEAEGYNPEADLEKFNESTELAAREAVLRGLYGTKSSVADVDHLGAKSTHADPVSPGTLKLSKVYDDDGEEIAASEGDTADLSYIALSNAALNLRLTSKDAFTSPGASRTPISQVNKIWAGTDIAAALDAINAEEFDTALHFSGPRSGPPSVQESPNVSITSASGAVVDLNRNDVHILPTPSSSTGSREKYGSFTEGKKSANTATTATSSTSRSGVPPPPHSANASPPVPPTNAEAEKKRRGSHSKKPK